MDVTTSSNTSFRILVVDDEAFNLEIIADYLEGTEYKLLNANDGYQAWNILEKSSEDIDLVLLDRMLPGLDGMQILAKMKEHPFLKYTPVILQTAKVGKQDVLEGMQAGAFYYLTKPFDENMLRSVVKTALDEHGIYKSLQQELKKTAKTLSLMRSGTFQFRTLKEVEDLALFISNACPVPDQVLTGLSELMINAVEHGNLGITYADKTRLLNEGRWYEEVEHRLTLPAYMQNIATLKFQHKGTQIDLTIEDMGEGFNWQDYLEIAIDRVGDNHGRGIAMAKIMSFDSIEYHGNGNEVTASINLERQASVSPGIEVINELEELEPT